MPKPRVARTVFAAVVAVLVIGVAACGESKSETGRNASSGVCTAYFGCSFPVKFKVVNDSPVAITLEADDLTDVLMRQLPKLNLSVPAQSSSPEIEVLIGEVGFVGENDRRVPGLGIGSWTWTIRTDSSTTVARVELRLGDSSAAMGIPWFEGSARIGQPEAEETRSRPVILTSTTGERTWSAEGSWTDYSATPPVGTWTFAPVSP